MDDIGTLGLTEGAKAAIDVFGSHSKVVGGARLELGECAGHGQWEGLHLPNPLPMLLGRTVGVGVVLVEGEQVVAVDGSTGAVSFCHAPGQHDAGRAGH